MATTTVDSVFLELPKRALVLSVALHVTVPLMFLTLNFLDGKGWLPFGQKKNLVKETYQNFIQVDVVALPDTLIGDKKEIDTSLPIVENPKTVVEDVKPTAPDTMESPEAAKMEAEANAKKAEAEKVAKEKARQQEQDKALKKIKEDADREAALKSLSDTQGKAGRSKIGGNLLSKGTSMTGKIGATKDQYTAQVAQAIKQNFNVYPWQRKKNLVTVVEIEIFSNGRVRRRTVIKPSKDRIYDSAVLQAIDSAQLPAPPDMAMVEGGIQIELRPEE